jgi:hypothetical protein
MDAAGWLRLIKRNRFAVDPRRLHWFALISVCALGNSLLGYVQNLLWSRRVSEARIVHAPVFIIGHWRSGTSLLHELLSLDPEHAGPTTYQCLFPHHFLLTESYLPKLLRFVMPAHRPMDNMPMSWEGPLEDEYAMCNLGQPSPYLAIAFPNERPRDLDVANAPRETADRWQRSFVRFLKQVTVRSAKRIILKSPPHTLRIRLLLELFPDARFVHIVRDPFVVFPSTVNLWTRLYRLQGLQTPTYDGLEEYVLENYTHFFGKLQESRALVPPSRFHELRYEDLVRDPVCELRTLYQQLDLGDLQRMMPRLEQYLNDTRDYKTNRYNLTAEQQQRIAQCWGPVIRQYGYA